MIDEKKVIDLRNFVDGAVSLGKKIANLDGAPGILLAKRLGKIPCRGIVTLPECRSENQNGAFAGWDCHGLSEFGCFLLSCHEVQRKREKFQTWGEPDGGIVSRMISEEMRAKAMKSTNEERAKR